MAVKVLSLGTFDVLHQGHLGLFKQCRRLAGADGQVIIGVNTDEFVTTYRGKPPLVPYSSRSAVIDALQIVDSTEPNYGGWHQPLLIERIHPDVLVVGDDWATKNYLAQISTTQQWLDAHNIQLCYVPRTGDWSSTALRAQQF